MTERLESARRFVEPHGESAVGDGERTSTTTATAERPELLSRPVTGTGSEQKADTWAREIEASGPRVTRRQLLQTALGACVVGATGYGVSWITSVSKPPPLPRFRSRPDLSPPPTAVLFPADETAAGLVLLSAARTDAYQHGPMIVDNAGRLVWFSPRTQGSMNLQAQNYLGKPVLTWWQGELVLPAGYGQGEYVIAGSDYNELARVHAGNGLHGDLHEFVITPQGTALFTVYKPIRRDLSDMGGSAHGLLLDSRMQEVEISTGRVLFEWSAAEHIALSESYVVAPSDPSTLFDFFHMNSIDVLADGNLLLSARHTGALYKIDRSSGAVIWRLGGKRSDFQIQSRAKFAYQHHARHHDGGVITVFDDGAGPTNVESGAPAQRVSRGLKLSVDVDSMQVRLLQEYLPDPSMLATSQGSVQLLSDGNVFVGWGSEPYFSEYGPRANPRFEAKIGGGSNSYRAFRSQWVGRPAERPAVAAERVNHATVNVFASWNGATDVYRWDVLAGNTPDASTVVGTFARVGFETSMQVSTVYRYIAVRARDGDGRLIGRSAAVQTPASGTAIG
ncbi:MAG TPA: arylsulfotransferase family protein [Solirubrobacteraceae bacterium]|jgi:outer membrane protein assembly factor BamB|nr:arylsulfotransferase family protein [Solirubrobacteraceae bacterium]